MKVITNITTASSHLFSDVTFCEEDERGHRDGFETIRVEHDFTSNANKRAADIEAAIAQPLWAIILDQPVRDHLDMEVVGENRVIRHTERTTIRRLADEGTASSWDRADGAPIKDWTVRELLDSHCDYNWSRA
jgi:hypothetical protein